MNIHAFKTGALRVKHRYVEAAGRTRVARLTSVLLDSDFIEIPVYTWLIEHPEGVILIDTGLTAEVHQPDYFPPMQRPYWRSQYEYLISPDEEVGAHLRRAGFTPADVRWLILTHAHFDHTGCINDFLTSEVLMTRKEYEDTQTFRLMHFAFPSKWSPELRWRLVDFAPQPLGVFKESYTLTQAGDVFLVPTPGHTLGHMSVIVQANGNASANGQALTYFFAGDASFDLPSLVHGTLDAPAFDSNRTLETRQQIYAYADQTRLVYLATHDEGTPQRLEQQVTL